MEISPTDALELVGRLARFALQSDQAETLRQVHGAQAAPLPSSVAALSSVEGQTEIFDESGARQVALPDELSATLPLPDAGQLMAARQALADAGITLQPERMDLAHLGSLLCYLVTGQRVASYLQDRRARALVPPDVRGLIDRAVRPETPGCFLDLGQFAHAMAELLRRRRELPFQKLGHFIVLSKLGRGGMGVVYKGYEPGLERLVAIKVLPAESARKSEYVRRFHAEASAAARVHHPNVIPIYFVGEDHGHHFFAMQLVDGDTLADHLSRRGRLEVGESLDLIEQVVAGLGAAHECGVVHRDIKPSNILLNVADGRAMIADFGLVKYLEAPGEMTAAGTVLGTVDYLAPEQGEGRPVDGRADLYSVGVVLFRMLSGRVPFQADSVTSMIYQHVHIPAPPLGQVAPHVPEDLVRITARLLAKSPDDRYRTAQELLADLRTFHSRWSSPEQEIVAGPISALAAVNRAEPVQDTMTMEQGSVAPATEVAAGAQSNKARSRAGNRTWIAVTLLTMMVLAAILWAARRLVPGLWKPAAQTQAATTQSSLKQEAPKGPLNDSDAARWALTLHGVARIRVQEKEREITAAADLPRNAFALVAISFFGQRGLGDAELALLPSLPNLVELNLANTAVTDKGLHALPDLPALRILHLGLTRTTNTGLADVARLKQLARLNLDNTLVTDAGLERLNELTALDDLGLSNTAVTDAGLKVIVKTDTLTIVGLNYTKVTDAGLPSLTGLTKLVSLHLAGTSVSDAGIPSLAKIRGLKVLELRDSRVTDGGAASLKAALPGCDIVR